MKRLRIVSLAAVLLTLIAGLTFASGSQQPAGAVDTSEFVTVTHHMMGNKPTNGMDKIVEEEWNKIKDEMEDVEVPIHDDAGQPILRPCGEVATERCRRCGLPLCETHKLREGHRCGDCESDWVMRNTFLTKLRSLFGHLCVLSFLGAIGLPLVAGWKSALLSLILAVVTFFAWNHVDNVERRRFLAETKR